MSHDDDTCPHLVMLGRLEADNTRLKAEVERLNSELHTCSCANANMHKYKEENARLKAEVERWKQIATIYNTDHDLECANKLLSEQVERLTKAGDAMWKAIDATLDNPYDLPPYSLDKSTEDWLAAKEGQQS